jgi:CHAD domain-containing protein
MGASRNAEFLLLRYLDHLVEELQTRLDKAVSNPKAEDIHKGRIAARRLKAAIDVLRPVVSEKHRKPLSRACKKLRRRLGPLRDSDIMLLHLQEIAKQARHQAAARWLAGQIKKERKDLQGDLSPKRLGRVAKDLKCWSGFHKELAEAGQAIDSLLAQSIHLQVDALIEQAEAQQSGRANDMHATRIAFKKLRYTVEMAQESGRTLPAGMLKMFKRIQDALGLWHDFVVIVQCSTDQQLAVRDAAMQQAVLNIIDHFLRQAMAQLARFGKLWSEFGEQMASALRDQFPLEIKSSGSKKDRGRPGSKRIRGRSALSASAPSNGQA